MEEKETTAVERFVADCNDMLTGRFLDFTRRLERLLSCMALSEDLVALLASSLENFDENEEMSKAFTLDKKSGAAHVTLPTDDKKKLALVTSLFNRFTTGDLNSTQFLETFFAGEVRLFLKQVLMPYRDAICKAFSLPTDLNAEEIERRKLLAEKIKEEVHEEKEEEKEELPHVSELFDEIEKNCNQILSLLQFEKKHPDVVDDAEFIVNAILERCQQQDLMSVNALVIGLSYASGKLKNSRHIVSEMNSLILDYYDYLASLTDEQEN